VRKVTIVMKNFFVIVAVLEAFLSVMFPTENTALAYETLPRPRWDRTFDTFAELTDDGKKVIRYDGSDLVIEDVESGNLIKRFTFESNVISVAISTHWVRAVLTSGDPAIRPVIWVSLHTLEAIDVPDFTGLPAISEDGNFIVGWRAMDELVVYDIWQSRVVFSRSFTRDYRWIPDPVFSKDNSKIAVPTMVGAPIEVWDITSSQLVSRIDFTEIRGLAFSPNGSILLTYGSAGAALWNPDSGLLVKRFSNGLNSSVDSAKFLPDGEHPFLFYDGNLGFFSDQGLYRTHEYLDRDADYSVLDVSPRGDSIFIYGCNPLNGRAWGAIAKRAEGASAYRFTEYSQLVDTCWTNMTYSSSGAEAILYSRTASRTRISIWDL
jgi:WD40 repeat protein